MIYITLHNPKLNWAMVKYDEEFDKATKELRRYSENDEIMDFLSKDKTLKHEEKVVVYRQSVLLLYLAANGHISVKWESLLRLSPRQYIDELSIIVQVLKKELKEVIEEYNEAMIRAKSKRDAELGR